MTTFAKKRWIKGIRVQRRRRRIPVTNRRMQTLIVLENIHWKEILLIYFNTQRLDCSILSICKSIHEEDGLVSSSLFSRDFSVFSSAFLLHVDTLLSIAMTRLASVLPFTLKTPEITYTSKRVSNSSPDGNECRRDSHWERRRSRWDWEESRCIHKRKTSQ